MNDLDFLIHKYYESDAVDQTQTSSHWKKYSQTFQVKKLSLGSGGEKKSLTPHSGGGEDWSNNYDVQGEGFGDFKKLTFLNFIFALPVQIFLAFTMWHNLRVKTFIETWLYTKRTNQIFGYDITRMSLTIDLLDKSIGNLNEKTFCVIGDGYGRLGSLLKGIYPKSKIIYINLGKTLIFDYIYSLRAHPNSKHKLMREKFERIFDFSYVEAESYRELEVEADIFINIASMQEMNSEIIADYFSMIKSQSSGTYFYCANRISKTLPDESIINFFQYPWDGMVILRDELCPWHQKFPTLRLPFIRKFDGPTQHRLVCVVK